MSADNEQLASEQGCFWSVFPDWTNLCGANRDDDDHRRATSSTSPNFPGPGGRRPTRSSFRTVSNLGDDSHASSSHRRVSFFPSWGSGGARTFERSHSDPDLSLSLRGLSYYTALEGDMTTRNLSPSHGSVNSYGSIGSITKESSFVRPIDERDFGFGKELMSFKSAHIRIGHEDAQMIKACREEIDNNVACDDWPEIFKARISTRVAVGFMSQQQRQPDGTWKIVYPFKSLEHRREEVVKATKRGIEMRNLYGINTAISQWKMFNVGLRLWPMRMVGYSTCGHPVIFDKASFMPLDIATQFESDPEFAELSEGQDCEYAMKRHCLRIAEVLDRLEQVLGKEHDCLFLRHIRVVDLSNFGYQMMQPPLTTILKFFGSQVGMVYPESIKSMHLINCPWVFSTCWAAIKGYLPERTSRKIHVNGNNFVEELLEVGVPLNIIPSDYGGGGKAFDDYALLPAELDKFDDSEPPHTDWSERFVDVQV